MTYPWWAKNFPWDKITSEAKALALDPFLVAAVIQKESAGRNFSSRFEPDYQWLVNIGYWAKALVLTEKTEEMGQKHSWGLMHVMGATAREEGFTGYFPELCVPEIGIRFGARYLKAKLGHWQSVEAALSAYNAGWPHRFAVPGPGRARFENQEYVDSVMAFYRELKAGS
jgi:hypothetical protein